MITIYKICVDLLGQSCTVHFVWHSHQLVFSLFQTFVLKNFNNRFLVPVNLSSLFISKYRKCMFSLVPKIGLDNILVLKRLRLI